MHVRRPKIDDIDGETFIFEKSAALRNSERQIVEETLAANRDCDFRFLKCLRNCTSACGGTHDG
jgi:hypothetical protein